MSQKHIQTVQSTKATNLAGWEMALVYSRIQMEGTMMATGKIIKCTEKESWATLMVWRLMRGNGLKINFKDMEYSIMNAPINSNTHSIIVTSIMLKIIGSSMRDILRTIIKKALEPSFCQTGKNSKAFSWKTMLMAAESSSIIKEISFPESGSTISSTISVSPNKISNLSNIKSECLS